MYAQITTVQVPMGSMKKLREIMERDYLPMLQGRAGFISALFLEQLDDPDRAQILTLWKDQAALETFMSNSLPQASSQVLAGQLPGVRVQREGHAVTILAGIPPDKFEAHPPTTQNASS